MKFDEITYRFLIFFSGVMGIGLVFLSNNSQHNLAGLFFLLFSLIELNSLKILKLREENGRR